MWETKWIISRCLYWSWSFRKYISHQDFIGWFPGPHGNFTVKSAYRPMKRTLGCMQHKAGSRPIGMEFNMEIRSSSKDVYHGVENGNRCVGYNLSKSLNLIVISVHRAHVLFMERIEKATCMRWSRACMLEVFGRVSEIIWLLWRCATNGFWQRLGCAAVVKVYGAD